MASSTTPVLFVPSLGYGSRGRVSPGKAPCWACEFQFELRLAETRFMDPRQQAQHRALHQPPTASESRARHRPSGQTPLLSTLALHFRSSPCLQEVLLTAAASSMRAVPGFECRRRLCDISHSTTPVRSDVHRFFSADYC